MRLSIRTLIPTLLFLLCCLASCNNLLKPKNSLIKAIPISAYVVMETRDITQLLSRTKDNEYLLRLTDLHQLENLKSQFSKLLTKLRENDIQLNLDNPVALSIHKTGSTQSDLLFTTCIKKNDFKLEETLQKLSNFTSVMERSYDENLIYSIDNEGVRFYFSYVDEYLFLTKNSRLISDAIRQCRAEHNLTDNSTFSKVYNSANQKDLLNVFLHVDGLKNALSPHSRVPFKNIRNYSDWMALDMSLGENYLLFNGISCTKDTLNSLHNYFKDQKANSPELFEIAPGNTEFLISYHFDEFNKFFRNKKQQLSRKGKFNQIKNRLKKTTFKAEAIIDQIDNEFAFLLTGKKIVAENQVGIAKITYPETFAPLLTPNSNSIENYRNHSFYQLNQSVLCEYLFGEDFKSFKQPYWTIIDNYWVFAISKANLRQVVNEHLLEHSLANLENFQKLKDNLSNKANIWLYGAALGNKSHFNQLLKKEYLPNWQKSITQLNYFEGWMIQLNNKSDYFNVNITTKLKEEQAETLVHSEWSLNLDNPISKPIEKVWNHKTKRWELIIQDDGHVLYLLNTSGEILWKKQLDEAILGKIHQIDFYKNKRLQLLFNTATKVHLLDRNGINVEDYPVELNEQSELGMAVFDYDNNRKYRLVIPTLRSLKMLDSKGNKVTGWMGNKIRPKTLTTPIHYNLRGKDYVLTFSEKSEFIVLDRKGEPRFNFNEKFNVDAHTKIFLNETAKAPHFEFVDTTGTLVQVSLSGKVKKSEFLKAEQYFVDRINGKNYLVEEFELMSDDQEFSFDLDNQSNFEIHPFNTGQNTILAICLNDNNKVYIVDDKGETLSGFPVYGNTGIFIDTLNENYPSLIVGSKEGTIYSYQVTSSK